MAKTRDCENKSILIETESSAFSDKCKNGEENGRDKTGECANSNRNSKLPVDRGWAWVIVIGLPDVFKFTASASFFEMGIMVGYFKCYGIFFVQLQQRFKSSSAATSLIFSLQQAFYSLSALLVMNLGQSVSSRVFVVIGSVVSAAAFFITGFMETLPPVYFVGGILAGIGFGCIQPNIVATLNTYFKKYRGLASNIAGCGVSVGALALAPVYTTMFEHYGFTSTYIAQAAIVLQVVVVGMLLRPMENYERCIRISKSTTALYNGEAEICIPTDVELQPICVDDMAKNRNTGSSLKSMLNEGESCTLTCESNTISKSDTLESLRNDRRDFVSTCISRLVAMFANIRQLLLNNRLLKNRLFLYFILCNVFLCSGCLIVEGYIAPHAVDVGISNDRVAILIISVAIADVCAKAPFAYLSDRKWLARSTIMAVAAIVLGVCSFFMFFLNTFTTMLVYAVVAGSLQQVYFILYPVVAVDIFSLDDLKSALGFIAMTQGVTGSVCFPLAGLLRDVTGRYYFSFCFAGALLFIGGVLCFFLPNMKTLCDRRSRETNAESQ